MKNFCGIRKYLAAIMIVSGVLGASTAQAWYPGYSHDQEVRKAYNADISRIYEEYFKPKAAVFHERGQSFGEALAREAVDIRNAYKAYYQKQTSTLGQIGVTWRESGKAHTYEEFIAMGKNPEEIAYDAFKTGGGDLGLKNNGFNQTVFVWKVLKENGIGNIYPEHIDMKMLADIRAIGEGQITKAAVMTYYLQNRDHLTPQSLNSFFPLISTVQGGTLNQMQTALVRELLKVNGITDVDPAHIDSKMLADIRVIGEGQITKEAVMAYYLQNKEHLAPQNLSTFLPLVSAAEGKPLNQVELVRELLKENDITDVDPAHINGKMLADIRAIGGGRITQAAVMAYYIKNYMPQTVVPLPREIDAAQVVQNAEKSSSGTPVISTASWLKAANTRFAQTDQRLAMQAEQIAMHSQAIDRTNARIDVIETRVEAIDRRAKQVQKDMQKLEKKTMRGIAAVAAMGNVEKPSVPGNMVATAGVGNYGGRQAVAVNINYRPEKSEPVNIHAGAGASSGGRPVLRMGASYEF